MSIIIDLKRPQCASKSSAFAQHSNQEAIPALLSGNCCTLYFSSSLEGGMVHFSEFYLMEVVSYDFKT